LVPRKSFFCRFEERRTLVTSPLNPNFVHVVQTLG
jgi:hypothetical protein